MQDTHIIIHSQILTAFYQLIFDSSLELGLVAEKEKSRILTAALRCKVLNASYGTVLNNYTWTALAHHLHTQN